MERCGVSRPMVADSHHVDEVPDPDPELDLQEQLDQWIRITVMRTSLDVMTRVPVVMVPYVTCFIANIIL